MDKPIECVVVKIGTFKIIVNVMQKKKKRKTVFMSAKMC